MGRRSLLPDTVRRPRFFIRFLPVKRKKRSAMRSAFYRGPFSLRHSSGSNIRSKTFTAWAPPRTRTSP